MPKDIEWMNPLRFISKPLLVLLVVQLLIYDNVEGVNRTREKDNKVVKQRKSWCSSKRWHKAKFNESDVQFVNKLCSPSWNTNYDKLRGRAVLGSRKEYRCMSTSERNGFHQAIRSMKNRLVGFLTEYDALVILHDGRNAPSAHFGPGFGPWHRLYLIAWERGIRAYCPSCMLPFWDSRLDRFLGGNPRNSVLFSPQLAGNADGNVVTGFSANWGAPGSECSSISRTLYRFFDTNVNSLYDDGDVRLLENAANYLDIAYPWNDAYEYAHGYVHSSFGAESHMADIICSPTDPLFILHHCFVDNLLERARQSIRRRGTLEYPDTGRIPPWFADTNGNVRFSSAGSTVVRPFQGGVNHRTALLSDEYTNDVYDYERSPGDVQCTDDVQCCSNGNTEFVWCDTRRRRCVSKAREGAMVNRAFPARACHCSNNRTPANNNGICSCR